MNKTFLVCLVASFAGHAAAASGQPPIDGTFIATAYDQIGITASGDYVHRHVIAADPDIIPIGSRIKVQHAGKFSGEYVVADTGRKIQGRRLDIFVASQKECIKFGKRNVRVHLISLGDGTHQATQAADQKVKQDVKKDLAANSVGNAATEADWTVKHAAEKQGAPPEVANEKAAAAAAPASPKKPSSQPAQTVPSTNPQ